MRNISLFLSFMFFGLSSISAAEIVVVGNDVDTQGCKTSAGYVWSVPMKKCIRTWEYYDISLNSFDTGNNFLNTTIQRKIDRLTKEFRREAESYIAELSLTGKTDYSLDIIPVIENSGSIISVRLKTYTFLGGAHGTEIYYTWNYDTKIQKIISLSDVITKKDLIKISKNAGASLRKFFPDAEGVWMTRGLSSNNRSNYQNFIIHADRYGKMTGITFYLSDYQIGPHSFGMPTLRVNLSDFSVEVL